VALTTSLLAGLLLLTSVGCAYRLQPALPPFQQRLRIVANNVEQYTVRVQGTDYSVPFDGRLEFTVGGMRGCSVYLFDQILIRRAPNLTKAKVISIMSGAAQIQNLSLHDLGRFPHDSEGIPQIAIPAARPNSQPARSSVRRVLLQFRPSRGKGERTK
jgi:hypothetical protein